MIYTDPSSIILQHVAPDEPRIADLFAGGGGASLGIENALGVSPVLAANHDEAALQVHELNHPRTAHALQDIFRVNPRSQALAYLRGMDLLWASPDCRHFSRAKGSKPVSKRVRGLAWAVTQWAKVHRPRVVMMENVPEFEGWGPLDSATQKPVKARRGETFRRFIRKFEEQGYAVEWRTLNAADYGTPSERHRWFLVARRDGQPIVWPTPTHGPDSPSQAPYRTAAECLDWSQPCLSIFGRKRPLAAKTLARVAAGVFRYLLDDPDPFFAPGEVAPFFVQRYGERPGQPPRSRAANRPMATVVGTGNTGQLVSVFLAKHYGGVVGHKPDRPLGTISGRDSQGPVATTLEPGVRPDSRSQRVVDLMREHLGQPIGTRRGQGVTQRLELKPEQIVRDPETGHEALRIFKDGVLYIATDVGLRMMQPVELAAGQGFPTSYRWTGTKQEIGAKIGNSVPPPVARALVSANLGAERAPGGFRSGEVAA